jgi:hypothetical protein
MLKHLSECIPGELLPADRPEGHRPSPSQGGEGFFCADQFDLYRPRFIQLPLFEESLSMLLRRQAS